MAILRRWHLRVFALTLFGVMGLDNVLGLGWPVEQRTGGNAMNESRVTVHHVRLVSARSFEEVAKAYEHFFFRYAGADLLVIDTSEIDFVERNEDLLQLLQRLQEPVKGTQYFLPLGGSD